jgi:uncharacterized protein
MFIPFFYELRALGIPIPPTAFLRLQKALNLGMVNSMEDFYIAARSIMIKSEKYFDLYDRMFAHYFEGVEFKNPSDEEMEAAIRSMLLEWLKDPKELANILGLDPAEFNKYTPEELIKYLLDRLKEQTERHDGGSKWIGTGGTSPVGHSGYHPGGMRVGGSGGGGMAIKVAMERRWKEYAYDGPIDSSQMAEALKRLRHLTPTGPKDELNIDETIYQTVRNGGEIEIIYDRRLKDKLKVILMMDNGGWSMDPYIEVCRTLFMYANSNFKDLKTYYFHNCVYDRVYADPPRQTKPFKTIDFTRFDPETRIIIVGDGSMAPYELGADDGNIEYGEYQSRSGHWWLQFLAHTFPHAVWLNPKTKDYWEMTAGAYTISKIKEIFPMFDLTLEGLDLAVRELTKKL